MEFNQDLTRSIALPPAFLRALSLLIGRMFGLDLHNATDWFYQRVDGIMKRVFGLNVTFGQLVTVSSDQIGEAVGANRDVSMARIDRFVKSLKNITPWTLVCKHCNEFPLPNKWKGLCLFQPGSLCPLCKIGPVDRVPILLRRLNWVSGELVDPHVEEDVHFDPEHPFPLNDDLIMAWVGIPDTSLLARLVINQLAVYQFLAYAHLSCNLLEHPRDGLELLLYPDDFHLTSDNLLSFIKDAKHFVADRELWNTSDPFQSIRK